MRMIVRIALVEYMFHCRENLATRCNRVRNSKCSNNYVYRDLLEWICFDNVPKIGKRS